MEEERPALRQRPVRDDRAEWERAREAADRARADRVRQQQEDRGRIEPIPRATPPAGRGEAAVIPREPAPPEDPTTRDLNRGGMTAEEMMGRDSTGGGR